VIVLIPKWSILFVFSFSFLVFFLVHVLLAFFISY
jgi:hypothetical protein